MDFFLDFLAFFILRIFWDLKQSVRDFFSSYLPPLAATAPNEPPENDEDREEGEAAGKQAYVQKKKVN